MYSHFPFHPLLTLLPMIVPPQSTLIPPSPCLWSFLEMPHTIVSLSQSQTAFPGIP